VLSIDPPQQLRSETLAVFELAFNLAFTWRWRSIFENLRAQFHFSRVDPCQHCHWRIAITLQ
jgi:hypothetical protein